MKQGKQLLTICLGAVLGLLAMPSIAADKLPVTDAATLSAMGFAPDAQNVFIVPNAPASAGSEAADFGLGTHYTGLAGSAFQCRRDIAGSCQYDSSNLTWTRLGTEDFATAEFVLPTGALITFIRWWASDTNAASNMSVFVFSTCLPGFAPGAPVNTVIASQDPATTGSTGNQSDFISLSVTVDNLNCTYEARARFDATTGLVLQKIRAQWHRQISPAPAVATFVDVPTSHPFYAFIEALSSSGVTTGCVTSPAQYCPDLAVTRGQMAAFLSRALGLYWP